MTMPTKQQNAKEVEAEWKILRPKFEDLMSVKKQGRSSFFLFPLFSLQFTADVHDFTLDKARGEASWSIQRIQFSSTSHGIDILTLGMGERTLTLKVSGNARMLLVKKEEA